MCIPWSVQHVAAVALNLVAGAQVAGAYYVGFGFGLGAVVVVDPTRASILAMTSDNFWTASAGMT
eukprot:CAMPEP_0170168174 /NCGR_PEP_ID=MMETSP0040_2-20121228/1323_1 /TAXON_ID=641309 /ORGANISM="Lotharella oceanica, Strain CCMP622" /LENGTH=64 /DNA_ID=CAMNT_0010406375 /DNA_START=56 /DNA_END=250 /DNA_ORIENTATION=-